nr:MAG TPA: N-acetyl-beta-D-glucosaminidase N-terminal domain [Caudoviricetes sp.]
MITYQNAPYFYRAFQKCIEGGIPNSESVNGP